MTDNKHTGDGIAAQRSSWSFSGSVARHFDPHVRKSVPYYAEGHSLVCQLTDYFVRPDSTVYEIGCSTGELTLKMAKFNHDTKPTAKFIGIDIEKEMIQVASEKMEREENHLNVKFEQCDILGYEFAPSDCIVAYYTVQFIPPKIRQKLIQVIYEALNWGGAFIMFEKVRGGDARFQDILTGMYHDYKAQQGYSGDEIFTKSMSLRGVLEPFTTEGNLGLLRRAGFVDVEEIFRCICFAGFVAIK